MRNDEQQPQQGVQPSQPYQGRPYNHEQQPVYPPAGPPPGYNPSNPPNFYSPDSPTLRPPGNPNNPNSLYNQEPPTVRPPGGYAPGSLPGNPNNPNNPYSPYNQEPPTVRPPSGYLPENMYNPNSGVLDESYYPDLTMDMGSSLGYSQSIQHHAISMPQPTQAIPKFHQTRLQQLREDRMRRQQRRMSPDATSVIRRKEPNEPAERGLRSLAEPGSPEIFTDIPHSPLGGFPAQANVGAASAAAPFQPAAAPAQDTGMIQRVKVARASSLISGALMLSSVLGLLQTFLFTYIFGPSALGDAYLQAYLIPNLIYTVVAGGALSSAFIPVFTSYSLGRKDEKTAWLIASSALNLAVIFMIIFSIIGVFLAPAIVPLYSAGDSPAEISLIITLTRIMLIQAVVLGSGVIVSAVLNTKQDFTRTALGTVLYNVGLILGLIPGFLMTFHERTSTPAEAAVYAATWGVVLAAVLQLGIQIPGLFKVKMRYTFSFNWRHEGVRRIYRQMVPRVINALMLSFSTGVDRSLLTLAALGATGVINEYFQAFSILLLPVSIFGSSVSTAAFPTLAGYVARQKLDRVRSIILETLRGILFLTVPSAIGLIILAFPIAQTLLEHGNFTLQGAQSASIPLLFFAIGLPALAAVEILTRSFYALQDSRTPVQISVAQFILKIALSIILLNIVSGVQASMGALALSTSIAGILEAVVLFILLSQRISGFNLKELGAFFGRIAVASGAMAIVLLLVKPLLDHLINTTSTNQIFIPGILAALVKLLIELGCGSAVFLVTARLLHMEEMNTGLVRRVLNLLRIPWL